MIKNFFLCALFTIFSGSILIGQPLDSLFKEYHASHHTEKLYITNDKPYYFPEETIWGAVYLVDGTNHIFMVGGIVSTIELVGEDDTVLSSQDILIKNGRGAFNIDLNDVVSPGRYTLRAYTNYQTNFDPSFIFQKKIEIIKDYAPSIADTIKDISVNFYPEGGYLVNGISCKVAFQVIDQNGSPTDISGEIIDNSGNQIQNIKTLKNGLGVFSILSEESKQYSALITINKKDYSFSLPTALREGIVLSATSTKERNILIGVRTNIPNGLEGSSVLGHIRGVPFLSQRLGVTQEENISIQKDKLPQGILHFTVFDHESRPVAERLIYNHGTTPAPDLNVTSPDTISSIISSNLDISLDHKSSLDSVTATISIYNETLNPGLVDHLSIKSYLLLQSDLKGRIHNIGDYFVDNGPKTRYLLDLMTMVHGWRRFDWLALLEKRLPQIQTPPRYHSTISGLVTNQRGEIQPETEVKLSIIKGDQLEYRTNLTDENGLFAFENIDLTDSVNIVITSTIDDKKNKIKILDPSPPLFNGVPPISNYNTTVRAFPTDAPAIVREVREQLISESLWSIQLDNVTVKSSINRSQKLTIEAAKRYNEKGLYHISSSQKFDPTEPRLAQYLEHTAFEMIQHVATRFTLVNEGGIKRLYVRYGDPKKRFEPPIFLDGIAISAQRLETIDPKTIALIDIPEGLVAASVYGAPLAISLLTKRPEEITNFESDAVRLTPRLYHFSATYNDRFPTSIALSPDLRSCLYWNPHVTISTETLTIRFKASEMKGHHILKIEGLSFDGSPFVRYQQFYVK